jgi:hypothetical protein
MRVGLRFNRSSARTLRHLAQRVRAADLKTDAAIFDLAADAATTGEPMILECENVTEAQLVAGGYAQYGIKPPTIEQLSGLTPGG